MKPSISDVVDQGLCIGCGGCAAKSLSNNKISMELNEYGIFQPYISVPLTKVELTKTIAVCPFNPAPEAKVLNENVIATQFLENTKKTNEFLGNFIELFAGHSLEYRKSASSGGIATWILSELFIQGIVDGVICVRGGQDQQFEYCFIEDVNELASSSKTRYYPITLKDMLNLIDSKDGRYAFTGLPCFIKTIRLRQSYDESFKKKVVFTVGIFCGGYKNKSFTDYLISKCDGNSNAAALVNYRQKALVGQASNYSFSFQDTEQSSQKSIEMRKVGDMWGTGLFKPLACDFCDDLSSELADISLGDAWISPYNNSPEGTNIIITRSDLAHELIEQGISRDELSLDVISETQACLSQKGNITHRRKGLSHRLALDTRGSVITKRIGKKRSFNILFSLVQVQRSKVRMLSHEVWKKHKNALGFDQEMASDLKKLRLFTRLNHLTRLDSILDMLGRFQKKIIRKFH
jgi:coenzyme F420-reducing hydrogenase beta subunit